mmetsp:Transcript_3205/g.7011  ORF Transcript_3205/g.7011 Transcript_3205/m.7011 type:complete len:251 (-) Transcript_3205:1821-2573(-)
MAMHSRCRFFTCLLALFSHHSALAWTTNANTYGNTGAKSKQSLSSTTTALFAGGSENHPSSSRRQWISKTVAATGISLLPPFPSLAAGTNVKTSATICDPTVSVLQNKNRLVYVLGTAHISDVSAQLAKQLVKDVEPDAVFIELDLKRVGGLPFNKIQRKQDRLEIPGPDGSSVIVPNIIPVSKTIAALPQSQQQAALTALFDSVDFGRVSEEHKEAVASLLIGANPGASISNMYQNLSKQGFKPGQELL